MKQTVLYYDCFSGICGDMNLAALLHLGVPQDHLEAELAKLGIQGWKLRVKTDSKKGIHGLRVDVDLVPELPKKGLLARGSVHQALHEHRSWKDIRAMIQGSDLPEGTKKRALDIFLILAKAEAHVHQTPVDEVHFHEVGAVDSIVDMVGAAICLEWLKPDVILSSSVELGGGFVKCQHGLIPVPAPAVVEIMAGAKVKSGAADKECTTPTGAAILAASVSTYQDNKNFTILKTAYGVGHRDMEIPNLLRVFWGERDLEGSQNSSSGVNPGAGAAAGAGEAVILECNLDDMSPEELGHVFEAAFAAGASDVWFTPILMKKNRQAVCLSVLCDPAKSGELSLLILRETSTLGLRTRTVGKTMLGRDIQTRSTSLGKVRIKSGILDGQVIKQKIEYDDLHALALRHNLSIAETQRRIWQELGSLPAPAASQAEGEQP